MKAIYRPSGRALEYAPLAANLYRGCNHGCLYCYAPRALKTGREEFHANPQPREGILDALRKDVERLIKPCSVCGGRTSMLRSDAKKISDGPLEGEGPCVHCPHCDGSGKEPVGPVLLCFSCDPYQKIEREHRLTRQAIEILGEAGIAIRILTKAPSLAIERDLDLLTKYDVEFGISAAFGLDLDDGVRGFWESGAEAIAGRFADLAYAHKNGVKTWVSMEPVIHPGGCCHLIESYSGSVDFWRVGKLNHEMEALRAAVSKHESQRGIAVRECTHRAMLDEIASVARLLTLADQVWPRFLHDVLTQLRRADARYYIKNDLWAHATDEIKAEFPKERS